MNPAECWGWDGAQRLHNAAIIDVASMMPLLLLRCKAFRAEPCSGRRENASWYVGPQAACSGSLAAGLQLTAFTSCPAGGGDGAGGAGVAAPAGVQAGLCLLVAAPVLLDVFGTQMSLWLLSSCWQLWLSDTYFD